MKIATEKLEITRMLTLSTIHITEDTAHKLDAESVTPDMNIDVIVYSKSEYGWFIYIPDEMEYKNIPQDLQILIKLARENNCQWLILDSDGPLIDELPIYEWK